MCVELEIEDEGNQLGEEALKKQDLNAAMQSKGGTPEVWYEGDIQNGGEKSD